VHLAVNTHVLKQQILRHFLLTLVTLYDSLDAKIVSVVGQLLDRYVYSTSLGTDDGAVRASLRLMVF
jgi:hypothetical protein